MPLTSPYLNVSLTTLLGAALGMLALVFVAGVLLGVTVTDTPPPTPPGLPQSSLPVPQAPAGQP